MSSHSEIFDAHELSMFIRQMKVFLHFVATYGSGFSAFALMETKYRSRFITEKAL
jgi:hypothetical protein